MSDCLILGLTCLGDRVKDRLKQEYRSAAKYLDARIGALQDELTHMQGSLQVSRYGANV